ncbi:Fanconi anemia core complex-associated protein 24-like [Daphnia pulicaria]|uniref:Fanconi anemia core complex-associated protein 24-like n=1 Tax=Daphnia pulicaria TaxID=35523 RepID=UPI001EEA15C0|nr:Fanconi anemia core complex-associated protein 24-like [Daphnia pulicaria]
MAGAYNNSEDDFKSSPPVSQKFVRKNQKIPVGHILASLKWRNTSVVQKMTESIKVLFTSDLGVVDFHPSGDCAVVYISAAEMIEGVLYKKRLAGLKSVKGIRKVIVAERTYLSLQQFSTLQQFAVLELELDLIPVTENGLHALLVQMVSAENKISKNPFMQPLKIQSDQSNHISNALKNVPKIGDKKIAMLVERFGSLQSIAMASVEDLSLLGPGLAREVRDYFN